MLGYLPLIAKNCWRNRRRTTLTILSIAASLSLLGIFMAIYAAFYFSEPTPEQALRLATVNKVSLVFPMPASNSSLLVAGKVQVTAGIFGW